jgi:hypothetical protein
MDNDLKSTFVPESHQTCADSGFDERGKAPTFHVHTGIRAGRFRDRMAERRAARSSSSGYWQGAEIR